MKTGTMLVQINPGHTGFDHVAALNIREACDDVFHKLIGRWSGNGGAGSSEGTIGRGAVKTDGSTDADCGI